MSTKRFFFVSIPVSCFANFASAKRCGNGETGCTEDEGDGDTQLGGGDVGAGGSCGGSSPLLGPPLEIGRAHV